MKRLGIVLLLAAALGGAAARAQQPAGRPWQELSPEEQRRAWENYQRYQRFRALPPQERERLRQNYETYRGFDPGQRQEFGQKYRRWKSGQPASR